MVGGDSTSSATVQGGNKSSDIPESLSERDRTTAVRDWGQSTTTVLQWGRGGELLRAVIRAALSLV